MFLEFVDILIFLVEFLYIFFVDELFLVDCCVCLEDDFVILYFLDLDILFFFLFFWFFKYFFWFECLGWDVIELLFFFVVLNDVDSDSFGMLDILCRIDVNVDWLVSIFFKYFILLVRFVIVFFKDLYLFFNFEFFDFNMLIDFFRFFIYFFFFCWFFCVFIVFLDM